jgi:hypothetical protein
MFRRVARASGGALAATLLALPAAVSGMGPATPACRPAQLAGSFVVVPGSQGAGSITYRVRLKNAGTATCNVSGRPGLRLLDRKGHRLPTHVVPDQTGNGTAALIALKPGKAAVATARFSPDIPGPGEPQSKACEPKAYRVRITLASPGSGSLTGPVSPPTPVCEHGRIVLGLLHR